MPTGTGPKKETFTHACIRPDCSEQYTDTDPDPYYCASHRAEAKKAAEAITSKLGTGKNRRGLSSLEAYDAAEKVRGFMRYKLGS